MAAFHFVALTPEGARRRGVLEADTERGARRAIRGRGLVPLRVSRQEPHAQNDPRKPAPAARRRLSRGELTLFTLLLGTLLESGMPVDDALLAVSRQSNDLRVRQIILELRSGIVEGQPLYRSMARYPDDFPEDYRAMVGAGEHTRHLPLVLRQLAGYVETSAHMRERIRLALLYPAVLTVTALAVLAALLTGVVPQVVRIFDGAGESLPAITGYLIALSTGVRQLGPYALVSAGLLCVAARHALRRPRPRRCLHQWITRVPLLGRLAIEDGCAKFARTLAILIDSGVDLVAALHVASQAIWLVPLRESVQRAARRVSAGAGFGATLGREACMPPLLAHLVTTGEASGELAAMLRAGAAAFEHRVAHALAVVLGLVEPVLILVMGAVVLLIVIAILLPVFEMNRLV